MKCKEKKLKTIKGTSFREFERHFLYVRCPDLLDSQKDIFNIEAETDGFFVLGYVDHEAGLSFRIISSAYIKNDELCVGKENKEVMSILRAESIEESKFNAIDIDEINLDIYGHYVEETLHYYSSCEEAVDIRGIEVLDQFRHPYYPDDVEIHFVGENIEPENMWLRLTKLKDNSFYGIVLDEPVQKIGIHIGDEISFNIHQLKDKSLHALHICE